jgi:hypothetical protein
MRFTAVSKNLEIKQNFLPTSNFDPMLKITLFGLAKPNRWRWTFWTEIRGYQIAVLNQRTWSWRIHRQAVTSTPIYCAIQWNEDYWGKVIPEDGSDPRPKRKSLALIKFPRGHKKLISLKVFGNSCKEQGVYIFLADTIQSFKSGVQIPESKLMTTVWIRFFKYFSPVTLRYFQSSSKNTRPNDQTPSMTRRVVKIKIHWVG